MEKRKKYPKSTEYIRRYASNPIKIYEAELHQTSLSATWRFRTIMRQEYYSSAGNKSARYGNEYRDLHSESEMSDLIERAIKGEFFMLVDNKSVRNPKERKSIKLLPWINVDDSGRPS